ncbi:hypothetical protein HDU81_004809 [Chytriomyces hyalinus]|nr:hypothetical protein HDU81_004809 [Chytriomyces hyalinus]
MVWMRNVVRALNELNFTLLVVDEYEQLRNVYNLMPDVMCAFYPIRTTMKNLLTLECHQNEHLGRGYQHCFVCFGPTLHR